MKLFLEKKVQALFAATAWPPWLQSVAFGLAYFASAMLSRGVTGTQEYLVTCWLPSGVFLGVLLLTERRHWLWLVLAGGLGDLAYNYLVEWTWTLKFLLLAHLGNSAAAVLGAWLVRRMVAERPTLDSVREFFGMLAFGGLLSLPLSATIGALLIKAGTPGVDWWFTWGLWYGSDLLGVLLLTPVLLAWRDGIRRPALWRLTPRLMEAVGLWLVAGVIMSLSYYFQWPKLISPLFLAIPCVIWASFRFGLRGVSTLVFFWVLLAQWFTYHGYGIIGRSTLPDATKNMEMLVVFGGFIFLSLLPAVMLAAQHRAEAALRASEVRLRAIIDHAPECVKLVDKDGLLLDMNPAGLRMIEAITLAEVQNQSVYPLVVEEHRAAFRALHHQVLRGESGELQFDLIGRKGTRRSLETHATPLRDAAGAVTAVLGLTRDITAHKAAEALIREQAGLLNKTHDAIMVIGLDDRYTFWNDSAERITGWSAAEMLGRTTEELFGLADPALIAAARRTVMATGAWQGEIPLNHKDGRSVILDLRVTLIRDDAGQPSGRISIGTDITEKKQLAEQFLRAQRMESIGMLASGIAHDLNNVLAPILMTGPLLRRNLSAPGDLHILDILEKSAERGAALVRQILGFVQGVSGEARPVQVKHLAQEIVGFAHETFPKSITIESHLPGDLWTVHANPSQIHQALLNLCVNARDAMPDGGTLTIRLANFTCDGAAPAKLAALAPGFYLAIQISDTGTGILPEVIKKIWDPFFTTKAPNKGTGLGLSTTRGIVGELGGLIQVETAVGQGTTFSIYLPTSDTGKRAAPHAAPAPVGNDQLILIVDDERDIREIASKALTQSGYRVITANSGVDAVKLFADRRAMIALVITDLNMPNLDGFGLVHALRRAKPDVKILVITGLASSTHSTEASKICDGFLAKPFTVEELLTSVDRVLHPARFP